MPRLGFAAPGLLIVAFLLLAGPLGVRPMLAQEASPAAGTPAAPTQVITEEVITEEPAASTPAPEAAPQAQTDVVTLVLWYSNAPDQDIIALFPIAIDAGFVAGPAPDAASVGTVDFPEDGSPPIVVVGDTTFETYPRPDGVIERWTWLDDFEGARPATLVMQLAGSNGAYENYFGTATLMSRDEGGVGGVIIVALRPPSPAAPAEGEEAAPAEEEAAPAEEVITEEQPDAAAEAAPADEGGIVIEGEAPADEPAG